MCLSSVQPARTYYPPQHVSSTLPQRLRVKRIDPMHRWPVSSSTGARYYLQGAFAVPQLPDTLERPRYGRIAVIDHTHCKSLLPVSSSYGSFLLLGCFSHIQQPDSITAAALRSYLSTRPWVLSCVAKQALDLMCSLLTLFHFYLGVLSSQHHWFCLVSSQLLFYPSLIDFHFLYL